MMKKALTILLCISMITITFGQVSAKDEEEAIDELNEIISEIQSLETVDDDGISYYLYTYGPVRRNFKIEFGEGNSQQINKIKNMIKFSLIQPAVKSVFVKNLTFNITYFRPVLNIFRLGYGSAFLKINNSKIGKPQAIICKQHKLKVEGFTGMFHYVPNVLFKPLKLQFLKPAKMWFAGKCDNLTVQPVFVVK